MIRRSCWAWAISRPALSHRDASSTLQWPAVDEFRCEPRTGAVPGSAPRSAHRYTVSSTVGAGTGDVSSGNTPGARSLRSTAAPGPIATSGMTDSQASIHGSVAAVSGKQPPHGRMSRWLPTGRNARSISYGEHRAGGRLGGAGREYQPGAAASRPSAAIVTVAVITGVSSWLAVTSIVRTTRPPLAM